MGNPKAPGPYKNIPIDDTVSAPWYIIQFDKGGRCENPQTRDHLLSAVVQGTFTDLYFFSHGWNNDWKAATGAYEKFIAGYGALRRSQPALARPYRPVMVGVFWPSTALVFPWESAPDMAAPDEDADLDAAAAEQQALADIAVDLPPDKVGRFYALAALQRALEPGEANELAQLMAPLYQSSPSEVSEDLRAAPKPPELVALWTALAGQSEAPTGRPRRIGSPTASPEAAGFPRLPTPREILRSFTVWKMKDRAGTVGYHGGSPLLVQLLKKQDVRVHLVGHSFGCKVCLSAICAADLPRQVDSLLLLQPAISALCFASELKPGQAGGYNDALRRVRLPILTTYSSRDFPLNKAFHRAVTRKEDLGEVRIAATQTNPFLALGGYGAQGVDPPVAAKADMTLPSTRYQLQSPGLRILSLNGERTISGHGDISNTSTWWALHQQVSFD